MNLALNDLEKKIGYSFKDKNFLRLALTHPSFNEHDKDKEDNQRLEFLGDSILSAVLSETLFKLFPDQDEGALSRKRAVLVRGKSLVKIAIELKIEDFLLMSTAELKNSGNKRDSTLEDAIESIIGAIFLDGGMNEAKKCILEWFGDLKSNLNKAQILYNPKGQLQEIMQELETSPRIKYNLIKEQGPPHRKHFEIDLVVGKKTIGSGKGKTKKEAEENAAIQALQMIKEESSTNDNLNELL